MKSLFVFGVLLSFHSVALADYAVIDCASKDKKQTVQLYLNEVSEIKVDSIVLSVNGEELKPRKVTSIRSEFGILLISVRVGNGPEEYNYQFTNLGSEKCFGVYNSMQKGPANLDIINSLGIMSTLNCSCESK